MRLALRLRCHRERTESEAYVQALTATIINGLSG
jgi:hypothetical protein